MAGIRVSSKLECCPVNKTITENFPQEVILLMGEVKNKFHPWRLCSKGFEYRGGTTQKFGGDGKLEIPPLVLSSKIWKCVKSNSDREILRAEETLVISSVFFPHLSGPPAGNALGYAQGNECDALIRGWTKYWNDIFRPVPELDANLVKALIGSESSFDPSPKRGKGKGLMQILEITQKIAGDFDGELKDRFVVANEKAILDSWVNICLGVRWLFHKRRLASGKLGKDATWEEAVA